MPELSPTELDSARKLIQVAFAEDLADSEDITTNSLVPVTATGSINVVSRESGVLSGCVVAKEVFEIFDSQIQFESLLHDGAKLEPGSVIAKISGSMRSILTAERTALNFLTMLSGTASLTRKFVDAVAGTEAKILDTRKTLPGIRELQKFAVRCGGGTNHRMGLFDAVLIKDNHLAWWSGDGDNTLANAVASSRKMVASEVIVEIEVDSLDQFRDAVQGDPDIVLLDNMTLEQLREAVRFRNQNKPAIQLEASGGVTLNTVADIAATGVDRISVGALTHSAVALDIGFDWRI
ncbi:carboxylating nicotinate-nucleotide diphosphorylase [Thalassoglobus sp.]|uniref:carboxylating nicotinate-nucleotide diphosphorylase n=1 Tax=Thalassoglobus sp. TaxID=2795869 RepID=UPI003AA8C76E